jgi:elongation factor P--(R)-beta-lysine ligase
MQSQPPQDKPWFHPSRHEDRRGFLLARNRIISDLRLWMAQHGFLEVDVPAMQISPGNEAHLHGFKTELIGPDGVVHKRYLHTSPEFHCKKLLAAGEKQIFFLGHVFRNRERTATHAAEFAMLEWYRALASYKQVIDDCVALVQLAAAGRNFEWRGIKCDSNAAVEWMTVSEGFYKFAGVDLLPTTGNRDALAAQSPVAFRDDDSWSDIFSRIMVEKVEPHLGNDKLTVFYEYPSCEAALARVCSHDARVAERFEVYAAGVELANGFGELTDAKEQRRRFEEEMEIKQRIYGERYPIDEELLEALSMMPETSGVALGLDRLIMLATGAIRIEQVQW